MNKLHIGLLSTVAAGCVGALAAAWLGKSPPVAAVVPTAPAKTCREPVFDDQVTIPGGAFSMGSNDGYPEEQPRRAVTVAGFQMDRYEVANAQFAEFIAATGYVTVAERTPAANQHPEIDPAKLVAGSAVFAAPQEAAQATGWWHFVPGANWRAPLGPGSSITGKDRLPVVHIAYEDAHAYAQWRGRRLPTEAEWERAASAGRESRFVWGRELAPDGRWRANIWQGGFPLENTGADGFIDVAPVGCFDANDYGLYDMIGNVWEWTADVYAGRPELGVIKGGSYLCAENFCARYRAAARQPLEHDFSASHVGFRTVADLPR